MAERIGLVVIAALFLLGCGKETTPPELIAAKYQWGEPAVMVIHPEVRKARVVCWHWPNEYATGKPRRKVCV